MSKPLVSILIPAFNAERFVADTLRSALAQTWPNKEIILAEPGSPEWSKASNLKGRVLMLHQGGITSPPPRTSAPCAFP